MKVFKIILLTFLAITLLFITYIFLRYSFWQKEFLSKREDVVCTNDPEYLAEKEDINIVDRIENFILSYNQNESMTFTKKEILYAIRDSVKDTGMLEIQDMCLASQNGKWQIYAHTKLGVLQLPWIGINVVKDSRQTIELYSTQMYIGDMRVPSFLSRNLLENINKGISDAIILVVENNFLGKNFKNVDLLKDSIVFEGGF